MRHLPLGALLIASIMSQSCAFGLFDETDDPSPPKQEQPPTVASCSDNVCTVEQDCTGREAELCASAPQARCQDGQTLIGYGPQGVCIQGGEACEYTRTETTCEQGCVDAQCGGDPCAGIACATPPAPTCINAQTLQRAKQVQGQCQAGQCSYELEEITCPQGCDQDACINAPLPQVIIAEALIHSANKGQFVELAGQPGQSLSGISLVDVRLSDGQPNLTIQLNGMIGADGLFVIASPEAPADIKLQADQLDSAITQLSTGPTAALRLEAQQQALDALAMGDFAPGATTYGEGAPAKLPGLSESISRDKALTDTDDNAADFRVRRTPTPGAPSNWTSGVDPNDKPPVAVLDCASEIFINNRFTANANGSTDQESAALLYHFSVDGQPAASLRHGAFMHVFETPGNHQIEVEVEDSSGQTHSASCTITAKARQDHQIEVNVGKRFEAVNSGRVFSFTGVPPVSEDGEVSYSWAAAVCSGPARSQLYIKTGGQTDRILEDTHSVSCGFKTSIGPITASQINNARTMAGVIDGSISASDSCTAGIGCSSLSDPVVEDIKLKLKLAPPVAQLNCPAQVEAGQEFMADASGSMTEWGGYQRYIFNVIDGSGSQSQEQPLLPVRFDSPGIYQIGLIATDLYQRSSGAVCTVEVLPAAQTPPDVTKLMFSATNTTATLSWELPSPDLKVLILRKPTPLLGNRDKANLGATQLCEDCSSPTVEYGAYLCGRVQYRVYTYNAQGLYSRGIDVSADLTGSEQSFIATNNGSNESFGQAIDIDGDWAIIGAPGVREEGGGAAFIFERTPTGWVQRYRFTKGNYYSNVDRKGESVAIHQDLAYVGTPRFDSGGFTDRGAVFTLKRSAAGFWGELERLDSPNPDRFPNNDRFGQAIVATDNVLFVSAPGENNIYAFHTNGGTDYSNYKIINAQSTTRDFGHAMAVDGALLVVGAPQEEQGKGAAYIFKNTGGTSWEKLARLVSLTRNSDARFGESVAIKGERVLVGAPGDGKIYQFDGLSEQWPQTETLSIDDPGPSALTSDFGAQMRLDQDNLIISAPNAFEERGGAYHYAWINDQWTLSSQLGGCGITTQTRYGTGIAIDGQSVLISAPGKMSGAGEVQALSLP